MIKKNISSVTPLLFNTDLAQFSMPPCKVFKLWYKEMFQRLEEAKFYIKYENATVYGKEM